MGQRLDDRLQQAERQAVADLFFAANSLAGVSAVIDDPAAHNAGEIAGSAPEISAPVPRKRTAT